MSRKRPVIVPIALVAGAVVLAVVISVLSFGVLMPLGALLITLSLFLAGFWIVLNRPTFGWRIVAIVLIGGSTALEAMYLWRVVTGHG